jgi:hypothetical protein
MPQTISITAYTFDELSDEAKEKAREWYREGALDYDWWDYTFEYATYVGKALGIQIDKIYFSGFYSQGDGACFVGRYEFRPDWREALNQECGGEDRDELAAIGETLQDYRTHDPDEAVVAVGRATRFYNHENTTSIESKSHEVRDALRDFMRWIYSKLRDEYEYLNADEQVDEGIRNNEYLFTENGRRQAVL